MDELKRYSWCHDEQKMIEDYLGAYVRQEEALNLKSELAKANERVRELEEFKSSLAYSEETGFIDLNKFAIENQIKALNWFSEKYCDDEHSFLADKAIEQLRKEQTSE